MSTEVKTKKSVIDRLFLDGTCINLTVSNIHSKAFKDTPAYKKLSTIEIKARILLNTYSYPFVGTRFVPYPALNALVEGCVNEEGGITSEGLAGLEKRFKKAYDGVRADGAPSGVKFSWHAFSLSKSDNNNESGKVIDETNHRLDSDCLEFIGTTSAENSIRILRAIEKFEKVLETGTTIKSSSVNALRKAISMFRTMDIAGDEALMSKLIDLESLLEGVTNIQSSDKEFLDKVRSSTGSVVEVAADFSRVNGLVEGYLSK